jgi:aryl-alcohol dehydrogenase-like predicted oxidoreductase
MKILIIFTTPNPKSFFHAWVWTRSKRTIPIPGFTDVAQVPEKIPTMELDQLSNEQMKKIDEVFEHGGHLLGL